MTQLRVLAGALSLLVAVGLLGIAAVAQGQDVLDQAEEAVADSTTPRVAGTATEFVLAISPYLMEPLRASDAANLSSVSFHNRFCNSPFGCILVAPLSLPSGALIIGLELDAFDTTPSGSVVAELRACPRGVANTACNTLGAGGSVRTGITETPGVVLVRSDLAAPHTTDNAVNIYLVAIDIAPGSSIGTSARINGLRVFYKLQVSPAPAIASFQDVPKTHPFFRHIEALKASGITAGCSTNPPRFCPNAPLTRGQMAVFLAIALGLHFEP